MSPRNACRSVGATFNLATDEAVVQCQAAEALMADLAQCAPERIETLKRLQTTSGDHHRIGRLRASRECQLRQKSVGSVNVIPLQPER